MDICIQANRVDRRWRENHIFLANPPPAEAVALALAWEEHPISGRTDLWRANEVFRPGNYPLAMDCWVIRFLEIPAVPAQQIERREITVTATVVRNAMMQQVHSSGFAHRVITDGDINQCIDRIALEGYIAGEWRVVDRRRSGDGALVTIERIPTPPVPPILVHVNGFVLQSGREVTLQGPIVSFVRAPAAQSRIQVDLGDGTSHYFVGDGRASSFRLPSPRTPNEEAFIQEIATAFQVPRGMLSDGATDVTAAALAEIGFSDSGGITDEAASATNDEGAFDRELSNLASIEVFLNGIVLNRGQYIINARCHSVTLDFVPEAGNMLMIRHSSGETNHRTDGTENEFGFPFFQYPPEESQPPTISADIQVSRGGGAAVLRWDETRFISRISDDFYGHYWEFFKKAKHFSEDTWVDLLTRAAGVPIEIVKRDHDREAKCWEIQWRPKHKLDAIPAKLPQLETPRRRREQTDILSEEVSEE